MVKTMWCRGIKMNFKFKTGFTLMELMVYIALLGGIVLIAGQAFSDSTKMRIRTQSMLQANQIVGNVSSILKDDIAQLGAKSSTETDDPTITSMNVFSTAHMHDVYMDPDNITDSDKDSSSFIITQNDGGTGLDKITMRRLRYTSSGAYDAVEQVTWFVEDNVLKRACRTIVSNTEDENCPSTDSAIVIIAEGIDKFKITPAKPSTTVTMTSVLPSSSEPVKAFKLISRFGDGNFEPINIDPPNGGETIRLSGFSMNYDFDANIPITNKDQIKANQVFLANQGDDITSWNFQCTQITLEPYIEYEISFSMPLTENDPSRMFCPGRDHMAVGFRYAENGNKPSSLSDFQFYPPTVGDSKDTGLRKMRFTTNETIDGVCLAFTFASFSPVASAGNINLANIKLRKIASSNYTFTDEILAIADKKNVKALKIEIAINKNGETGTETAIVSIPSNGPRD